jgi:type IV pilus assembly protein PilM
LSEVTGPGFSRCVHVQDAHAALTAGVGMFKLYDTGLYPIGIDVGTHAVRMVQFRAASPKGQLKLQAACRIELDSLEGAATGVARLAQAVGHALSHQDFKGREAVLSLPVGCVHAKSVRLPQMPDSDLSQALQWEAKDRFGFDVGEAQAATAGSTGGGQLVWFRAGEVRRGTEVKDEILLFAVQGGVLNDYIQALGGAGLRLRAVDLAPCAIHRSLHRAGGSAGVSQTGLPSGGITAILDLGHVGAQFFIIRGEELVFFKHIEVGGKAIDDAVAAKLGVSVAEAVQMRTRLMTDAAAGDADTLAQALADAARTPLEELARELDMCMRYYVVTFRGSRPECLALVGRQSASVQVREVLTAALGLQVEEAQSFRGVQELGEVARPDRSGEWAVAAGLSLYPGGVSARLEAAA